ncbi:unnamed protein product [Lupinus luteus]|uniref:Trehalose 6-phosphate phosphatase n=1 Tax=Lupinus luteus TaxID=3873 RepID=A0AAV1WRK3_LUPLU
MDLKSSHVSSVPADPVIPNKSRLGMQSSLLTYSQQDLPLSPGKYSRTSSRKSAGSLDDVRSNGWLDAMIASSPPKKKPVKGSNAHFDFTVEDNASSMMRATVRSVANYFPTAIISGRSRDKVFDLVKLKDLYYAGSHGMDIICPFSQTLSNNHPSCVKSTDNQGKEITLFQPATEFLPLIDEVFRTLVDITRDIEGVKVENHKFCVSVHYRNVKENNWTTIGQIVHDVVKKYPRLRSTHGRKVLDIRPVIDWNKGKALEFLHESLGLNDRDDVFSIYIGDDKTDEDAFKVLRESNRGYGILVSSVKQESKAFFSLEDPTEVMKFLQLLVNWKRQGERKTSEL